MVANKILKKKKLQFILKNTCVFIIPCQNNSLLKHFLSKFTLPYLFRLCHVFKEEIYYQNSMDQQIGKFFISLLGSNFPKCFPDFPYFKGTLICSLQRRFTKACIIICPKVLRYENKIYEKVR